MEKNITGWIICNEKHPSTGSEILMADSFKYTKRSCIAAFIKGSNETWVYWRRKFNFKCVKAEMTVKTL